MKTDIKRCIAVVALITAFVQTSNAQVEVMKNYIFSQDSIAGFDEQSASAGAFAENFFGDEYKVFMYRAKRTYIKQKYGLRSSPPRTLFQNPSVLRPSAVNAGGCNNEDFELATSNLVAPSTVQGWTIQSGSNSNSCNPPSLTGVNLYTVYSSAVSDDRMPNQVSSFFDAAVFTTPAGHSFIRLNDDTKGAKAVTMSKSFVPTSNSALFQYAYLAVIESSAPHGCCQQPGFNIKMTVTNTVTSTSTLLACPNISVVVPGPLCTFTIPVGGPSFSPCIGPHGTGWSYADWTTSAIDLTPYIGYMVQIDVTVVDCTAGGHGAYFYFDAKCSPMVVTGNGVPYAAGTQSVLVPTCGANGATICATPGLGPYSWAGPNVPANYSVPSLTNSCYTSSISAQYTLYMQPPGSCAPIGRAVSTTITPAPLLLANIVQASCGGTAAVITLTPSGSASVPSTITWSPTPLTLSSSTTVATYTAPPLNFTTVVTVTATDPLGCLITQTLAVIPPAPYPTFSVINSTGSPSITCFHPTVSLNAQTNYTYGTLSYFWSTNSNTYTTNQIDLTGANGVTVVATDNATHCQSTHTLSIGVSTIAPTTAITPSMQNLTCASPVPITVSISANPSVNVSHAILSPYGGSATATSYTMIYVPSCGVYTHITTNDINGCTTTKLFTVFCSQGFPTFNVISPQSFTLGCNSTSCAVVNIVNGNTDPPGGGVSYTLLTTSSTLNPTGPLNSNNTYTVCGPGTYTVITRDNTSFCETRIPISVLQHTLGPDLQALVERNVLDCNHPQVVLRGTSTNPNAQYMWGFVGTPNILQSDTILVQSDMLATTKTLVNTYTLTITDGVSTCRSASVIPILQNLFTPHAVISNGGTSAISCKTPTVVLTNMSSTGIPNGTFPNGSAVVAATIAGPTPQEPAENATTYTAQTVGVYTATIKDLNNGCVSIATVNIADARVYPNLVMSDSVVLDCGASQVNLTLAISNATSSAYSFQWKVPPTSTVSAPTTQNIFVNEPGDYSVLVTNTVNGCTNSGFVEVVNGKLTADFEPEKVSGTAPFTVDFINRSASTNGNDKIYSVWNFANGSSATYSTVQNASTTYWQPGTYTVSLFVTKGTCMEKVQRVISVDVPSFLEVPNVFTPNGDGVNDFFFLRANNLHSINIKIVDRWGHIVYELSSATGNIIWDGKNQYGKEAAAGTYFYVIKATGTDGEEYNSKGTVSIYR